MKWIAPLSLMVALAALFMALQRPPQDGETLKLGFVRTAELLAQTDLAKEAREKLDAEKASMDENLRAMQKSMTEGHETFLKEQEGLSAEARKKRIQELAKLEGDLNRYETAAVTKLRQKEQEIMQPVFEILNKRIADFAEKEGYTLIWGTLAEGNILYGTDAADITDTLIEEVNRQK